MEVELEYARPNRKDVAALTTILNNDTLNETFAT